VRARRAQRTKNKEQRTKNKAPCPRDGSLRGRATDGAATPAIGGAAGSADLHTVLRVAALAAERSAERDHARLDDVHGLGHLCGGARVCAAHKAVVLRLRARRVRVRRRARSVA